MSVDVPRAAARSHRLLLGLVLGGAAALYAWGLPSIGWMNQYYAAVAQAGAASWRAALFATPDLTAMTATDKPPLAFWPMALAVRLLGLHPWSVALPQLLETLATALLLALTVRLVAGRFAALAAALAFASTPVVLVLARFDDPDTLLTLLMTAAAYVTVRAARSPRTGWLVLLGALLGAAFLTKWLVALLPVPALAAVLLRGRLAGRGPRRPRGAALSSAGRAVAVVGGVALVTGLSWVALDVLTPPAGRPFPDSRTGSIVSVILGQNGLLRLVAGGPAHASPVKGLPGLGRLVSAPFAGQVGWLLPAAVVVLAAAVVGALRRRPGPLGDGELLFGGWLGVTALVFSTMGGAMHPYYTDLLAPAVAGLAGIGAAQVRVLLRRPGWAAPLGLAAVTLGLAGYAAWVLGTYPSLAGWRPAVLLAGGLAAAGVLAGGAVANAAAVGAPLRAASAAAMAVALLLGPVVFAASTLRHQVRGADPLAGPVESGSGHVPYSPALLSFLRRARPAASGWAAAVVTATPASELQLQLGRPVLALGGFTGQAGFPTTAQLSRFVTSGRLRYVVLAGPYDRWSGTGTPPGMVGTAAGAAMAWAGAHGCRVLVPGARYAVLDLGPASPCTAAVTHR